MVCAPREDAHLKPLYKYSGIVKPQFTNILFEVVIFVSIQPQPDYSTCICLNGCYIPETLKVIGFYRSLFVTELRWGLTHTHTHIYIYIYIYIYICKFYMYLDLDI